MHTKPETIMTGDIFEAVIDLIPENFAGPNADFRTVRNTMAPSDWRSAQLWLEIRYLWNVTASEAWWLIPK